ncbi:MAG TPA: hypothetical protein VGN51_16830, partial [Acidimicrobiia bacterium]|jgi:hypothetical protein
MARATVYTLSGAAIEFDLAGDEAQLRLTLNDSLRQGTGSITGAMVDGGVAVVPVRNVDYIEITD